MEHGAGEGDGAPASTPESVTESVTDGGAAERGGNSEKSKWEIAEQPTGALSALTPPLPPRPARRPGRRGRRITASLLLVSVLALAASGAVSTYQQYSHVHAEAADGLQHLKRVQALLAPDLQHPQIPDAATVEVAQSELRAAEHDFALTKRDLGRGVFSLAAAVPAGASTLDPVAALSAAADEACLAGLDLVRGVAPLIPLLHSDLFAGAAPTGGTPTDGSAAPGSPSAASAPPALSAAMVQELTADFEDAVSHIRASVGYAGHADLSALPANLITAQQRSQLTTLLAQWPHIASELVTVDAWLHVAPTLLGLSAPTRLLVELMDRGEMRATGGYIGDYGVLTIQNGRIQPFTLIDINSLDYRFYGLGRVAPPQYAWWPFKDYGLRDSNLSGDFPTSAQLGMQALVSEGGPEVQGVVALNAVVIERVLAVVGPVAVPEYNEFVTSQNLEDLIRRYTESPSVLLTWGHEQFTIQLGRAFMAKLHGLPADKLVAIAQAMLTSLRMKDMQVYLSDKPAEALLAQQGFDGAITHGPGDGLTIVDDNVSVNKASVVTTISAADAVALDAAGTATHHLTITYHFDSSTNPGMRSYFFGVDWYLTYLRVYAPPNAQLASQDGFNWGHTEINASDEPGRQMWGGFVYVRDGVPYALHFVWSMPGAVTQDAAGHPRYTLITQHQSGSNQQLNLTIAAAGATSPLASYSGALDQDRTFSVTAVPNNNT